MLVTIWPNNFEPIIMQKIKFTGIGIDNFVCAHRHTILVGKKSICPQVLSFFLKWHSTYNTEQKVFFYYACGYVEKYFYYTCGYVQKMLHNYACGPILKYFLYLWAYSPTIVFNLRGRKISPSFVGYLNSTS